MARPIALSRSQTIDYILKSNREDPPEHQTTFKLGVLPYAIRKRLYGQIKTRPNDGQADTIEGATPMLMESAEFGIVGWENFVDANNAQVEFERENGRVAPRLLDMITASDLLELGKIVFEMSSPTADEKKK